MIMKMIALDWQAQKGYQIRYIALPIYAFFMGWIMNLMLATPVIIVMTMGFSVMPFYAEDKGDLNRYYLTLPVKRKSIVAGRFVLSYIMMLCALLMCITISFLIGDSALIKFHFNINERITLISLSYLLYAVMNLSMFPLLFRLGYQKGKFWGYYLPFYLFLILYMAYYFNQRLANSLITYAMNNILLVNMAMVVFATIILFLSYFISVREYSKRDF